MKIVTALKDKMKKMNKKSRIMAAVLAGLVLAGLTGTVYSKYYKTGYNKGITWQLWKIPRDLPWILLWRKS